MNIKSGFYFVNGLGVWKPPLAHVSHIYIESVLRGEIKVNCLTYRYLVCEMKTG